MQGALNARIGVDTLKMRSDWNFGDRKMWTARYLDEFVNECVEARDNFYHKWWSKEVKENRSLLYTVRSREKLLVELIDMLHFLVSALHLFDAPCSTIIETLADKDIGEVIHDDVAAYYLLNNLIGEAATQWRPLLLIKPMRSLFRYFGMDDMAIYNVYEMKHAANIKRQEDGYSVETKTETDNESIEQRLGGNSGRA